MSENKFYTNILFLTSYIVDVIADGCLDYWIGLSDLDGDGTYKWTDGSDVMYSDWASIHYDSGSEICVKIQYGKWVKLNICAASKCFICER